MDEARPGKSWVPLVKVFSNLLIVSIRKPQPHNKITYHPTFYRSFIWLQYLKPEIEFRKSYLSNLHFNSLRLPELP